MTAYLPRDISLVGHCVGLAPLREADLPDLAPILMDPAVYASGYVMHRRPATTEDALALGRSRFLAADAPNGVGFGRIAFAVRLATDSPLDAAGSLVGTTSLGDAHLANESIHLGWTIYGSRWWGTAVNAETKYLLLRHCFEELGFGRVKLQTDRLNVRSAAAIAKLGATREGVLRRETRREDGSFRDTVVFSVLADEWPAVSAGLLARLNAA
ncbi:MAG TPA: GNAT family protein [Propionicimonas sp.]|nr:GNAT family protein [Propionicimonas sp.]HQA78161.1 GNAT family protein [Propionicimonas sp.]